MFSFMLGRRRAAVAGAVPVALARAWLVALAGAGLVASAAAQPAVALAAAQPAVAPAAAQPAGPVPTDAMAARLQACTTCHGVQGRATPLGYVPRLAGKPADYLFDQLRHYRDGQRQHAAMAALLQPLDDAYLREIAAHFAAQQAPYPAPPPSTAAPAQLARGRTLALQGDAARGLPACVQCHGATLMGQVPVQAAPGLAPMADAAQAKALASATRSASARAAAPAAGSAAPALPITTPALLGLPRDYLLVQLGGWRTGQRRAAAPDCMADVARALNPEDLTAVAAWLAAQPVPADSRPVPAAPHATGAAPPACGTHARQAAPAAGTAPAPAPAPAAPAAATSAMAPAAARAPAAVPAPADTLVQRGAYLARAGNCAACHTAPGGTPYAGGKAIPTPFGTVYGGNLTPDAQHGLGRWSADDFWRALHQGRGREGRRLVPVFPYTSYTQVTRADSDALFAYLRSLPPAAQPSPAHQLRWPYGSQAALAVWQWLYFKPQPFVPEPARSAEWNRGAYLVQGLGHCAACHAPRNALGATLAEERGAGGQLGPLGWYAPSLWLPHEAGVATWPQADVVQLLRTGRAPRASTLGPMAEVVQHSTQHLALADLNAIASYLRAPPGGAAAAPPTPPAALAPEPVRQRGAALFGQHCATCHGARGQGVGAWPALAGNRAVTLASPTNVIQVLLQGGFSPSTAGQPRPHGMPPALLGDDDLAALATHLRQSWGHRASAVSTQEVRRLRDRRE